MSNRFFVETPITGDRASLVGAEAHHATHVMRARVGSEFVLFDGTGAEFAARVVKIGRKAVDLDVLSRREVDRESPRAVTLGVALPKDQRQRWLIEKAVELGVARVVPLATERGVAQPQDKAIERLRRAVVEASKQCGRNRLMEVATPLAVADFARTAPPDARRLIAHPGAGRTRLSNALSGAGAVYFAVGPEGGFSEQEIATMTAAGWQAIGLGPRILRIETAALALAAMSQVSLLWEE